MWYMEKWDDLSHNFTGQFLCDYCTVSIQLSELSSFLNLRDFPPQDDMPNLQFYREQIPSSPDGNVFTVSLSAVSILQYFFTVTFALIRCLH